MLSFLTAVAPKATPAQTLSKSSPSSTQPSGYVLQWGEGDKMILGRRRAPLNIKVSLNTGSRHLLMGTEQIAVGTAIPVHLHEEARDEAENAVVLPLTNKALAGGPESACLSSVNLNA